MSVHFNSDAFYFYYHVLTHPRFRQRPSKVGLPQDIKSRKQVSGDSDPMISSGDASRESCLIVPVPPESAKSSRRASKRNSFLLSPTLMDDDTRPALEKLESALIEQKEQGMSAKRLLQKFKGYESGIITRSSLGESLQKKLYCTVKFSSADLDELVIAFRDLECQPAEISSSKLCDFCFHINHIGWKAEKKRLGYVSGSESWRMTQQVTVAEAPMVEDTKGDEAQAVALTVSRDIFAGVPQLLGVVQKLFWKTNNRVEIRVYSNGDVVSVLFFSITDHKEYPTMHLKEEELREITETKDTGSPKSSTVKGPETNSASDNEAMDAEEDVSSIERKKNKKVVDHISSKLQFSNGIFMIGSLSDLVIKDVPDIYQAGFEIQRGENHKMEDFDRIMGELTGGLKKAGEGRKEADRRASRVRLSLDAFGSLFEGVKDHHNTWNAAKKRWKRAINSVRLQLEYKMWVEKIKDMRRRGINV